MTCKLYCGLLVCMARLRFLCDFMAHAGAHMHIYVLTCTNNLHVGSAIRVTHSVTPCIQIIMVEEGGQFREQGVFRAP